MASNTHKYMKKCTSNYEDAASKFWNGKEKLQSLTSDLYNYIRDSEKQYGMYTSPTTMRQLFLNDMDHEQIYLQVASNDDEVLDPEKTSIPGNLCNNALELSLEPDASFQLCSDLPVESIQREEEEGADDDSDLADMSGGESDGSDITDDNESEAEEDDEAGGDRDTSSSDIDEGVVGSNSEESLDEKEDNGSSDEDEVNTNANEYDENNNSDQDGEEYDSDASNKSTDSAYDELDKKLIEKYTAKKGINRDDESEVEDLALASGEESDSENDSPINEDEEEEMDNDEPKKKPELKVKLSKGKNKLSKVVVPAFTKTSVDSDFFNVRESEWIADEDIIGADNFADVDFMADSDEEGDAQATYADFFDEAPANMKSKKRRVDPAQTGDGEEEAGAEDWGVAEEEDEGQQEEEGQQEQDEEQQAAASAETAAVQSKSRLEEELEKENRLRAQLEESNMGAKTWTMKGEVRAADRPANSVLTEYLDFRSGARIRPEINDELNRRLEKLATARIRTKTYDSVERKIKLVENPFEYKKKIVLDQEKSQKSLSKIYEDEYLKKERLDSLRQKKKELPEHKEIKKRYRELEHMLNRLFRAHYTPIMKSSDLTVRSNTPAMSMEDATPDVMCDADRLAPQEILEPTRGSMKGSSERTDTDKNRDRRQKKHRQGLKHKEINKRIDAKVKKAEKDGKRLDVDTSAKVVKKAIKVGQVTVMDNKAASVKSSTSFFKQLNETHSAQSSAHAKKRKRDQAS